MKILYFSWLREKIGVPFEELEVQSENVHDLIKELIRTDQKYALAFEDIKSIRVAVDQKLIQNLNVSIKNSKKNKGTITFMYHDIEQLNKIIDIIKTNY